MVTKASTIKAIEELIFNYKNNIHNHGLSTCPLCIKFRAESGSCTKCPNIVFMYDIDIISFPCRRRSSLYNLSYLKYRDTNNLIEFWTNVKKYLQLQPAIEVRSLSTNVQRGILQIAEKYKNID